MKITQAEHGFSTQNTGIENSRILNNLLNEYDKLEITEPGEYPLEDTILLGSNQSLIFGNDVYIRREKTQERASYVIANKGAYTRTYDENIAVIGLKLITDGVQSSWPCAECKRVIPGLRGHISFFYVKNLVIKGFEAKDTPPSDFAIHICTFENVLVEDVVVEGKKDAVHLGRGKNFVIRNGHFRTFDDPIALNAHDYSSSNPQLGWIENGLIENCYDLNDSSTTGFFCRVLAGSWCDWYEGMKIQNSDTVIANGRMYRALMKADGEIYISKTAPSHKSGYEIVDGINWVFVQDEIEYNCGCKNITFKDIYIEKDRPIAFSFHFDNDNYSRSVYPGSQAPIQENITFKNVQITGNVPVFLSTATPAQHIKISDSELGSSFIKLIDLENVSEYIPVDFIYENTKAPAIEAEKRRSVKE